MQIIFFNNTIVVYIYMNFIKFIMNLTFSYIYIQKVILL